MTDPIIVHIPLAQLQPHPDNPRRRVGDVTELADSIRSQGLQQPLLVTPHGTGEHGTPLYRVVIGHRRLAALRQAGMTMAPCLVRDLTARQQREIMLVENCQRSDLTPLEEADGYQGLLDLGATVADMAEATGRSTSFVRGRLKVAGIPQSVRDHNERFAQLSLTDLDAIAEFADDPDTQAALAEKAGTTGFDYALAAARRHRKEQAWVDACLAFAADRHLGYTTVDSLWNLPYNRTKTINAAGDTSAETWYDELDAEYHTPDCTISVCKGGGHALAGMAVTLPEDPADRERDKKAAEAARQAREAEQRRLAPVTQFDKLSRETRETWIRTHSAQWAAHQMRDAIATLARLETLGVDGTLPTGLDANLRDKMLDTYQRIATPLPDEKKDVKHNLYHLDSPANVAELRRRAHQAGQELRQLTLILLSRQEARLDKDTWRGKGWTMSLKTASVYYNALAELGYEASDEENTALAGGFTETKEEAR
ncbi:ParB/RepB/Spo0J family partition protein [Bifidobacterium parmae]|uniref:ParB-like protein n=1 Tax=Bifidobacterium parmae TaxID=361854 RepID=A0A2N5IVP5_9BIFI|nr:ParB/RepB/Spo0J family partition protein [Bifidobacterium parmae]PLS26008.1 ParB-like protein [Bifidobacterium parmae]